MSAIQDLHDNSIVSFVIGHSNNNALVFETFDKAVASAHGDTPLLNSDRGYQYTSPSFYKRIQTQGMVHSMPRVGRCIDNAPIESFWGHLKSEMYHLRRFNSYEELVLSIEDYIQFYNYRRKQKKLNCQSPMEYRALAA